MIKLIVSDLDGTLLNSKFEVSDEDAKALVEAQEKGIKVLIASGRGIQNILDYGKKFNLKENDGYIVGYNGQVVYCCKNGYQFDYGNIDYEIAENVLKYCIGKEIIFSSEVDGQQVAYHPNTPGYPPMVAKFVTKGVDLENRTFITKGNVPKFTVLVPEQLDTFKIAEDLRKIINGRANLFVTNRLAIESNALGINKVNGIKWVCETFGYKEDEVFIMGDGDNDVEMLKAFPNSCATANAFDSAKNVSKYLTASHDDNGVAKAIYKYVLNE